MNYPPKTKQIEGDVGAPDETTHEYLVEISDLMKLSRGSLLAIDGHNNDINVVLNVALLPPAGDIRKYEKALPGSGDYIMKAADEQRVHRLALEGIIVKGIESRRSRALWTSFILSMAGLIGATAIGIFGNPWVAGLLALVSVGGPLAAQTMAQNLGRQDEGQGPAQPALHGSSNQVDRPLP